MSKRSLRIDRLNRKDEKATIKRIVYLTIVSLVLLLVFFFLGLPFLGKSADFIGGVFHPKQSVLETSAPQAPVLDDLPQATNSARLIIRGFSNEGKKVEIFQNDEKVAEADIVDSHFNFEDFRLKDGENIITARTVGDTGKTSSESPSKKVVYNTKEPKLEVESPTEGQNFLSNNRIRVIGKTDSDSVVYANGFLASVNPDGRFDVFVPVSEGETTIEIKAVNQAGNEKTEKRKINFHK